MKKHTPDMSSIKGKTIAVSGSTGGLGRELCIKLVKAGAELVLLDRNPEKAKRLISELKKISPEANVRHTVMDMEKIESVVLAAESIVNDGGVDALVLSAGAYHIPRKKMQYGT